MTERNKPFVDHEGRHVSTIDSNVVEIINDSKKPSDMRCVKLNKQSLRNLIAFGDPYMLEKEHYAIQNDLCKRLLQNDV